MTLMTAFGSVTVAVASALVVLLLYAGEPANSWWWVEALPIGLWVIAPAVAPYLLAARQSRRWFSMVMLLWFAVSSVFSGLVYCDAFFRSKSSTAVLVFVFIPIYQWLALAVLLLICRLASAWLTRRNKAA